MDTFDSGCVVVIILYYLFMGLWLLSEKGKAFFTRKGKILGIKDKTFLHFIAVTLIAISVIGAMFLTYYYMYR